MSSVASALMPSSPMGAVTSLFGGVRSGQATDRAANHQIAGQQEAQAQLRDAQSKMQPYMDSGAAASGRLNNSLSSGALGGTFSPGDLTKDPGYQFRLQQGEQALGRKQSANGNMFSGQALKEAQQYGQGLADQTYNDAFNRWMSEQKNTYGMNAEQAQQGLNAANSYGGYSGDIGKYASGIGDVLANRTIEKENQRQKMFSGIYGGLGGK